MKTMVYPVNFTRTELEIALSANKDHENTTRWLIRSLGELSQSIDGVFATCPDVLDAWKLSQSAIVFEMERLELLAREQRALIEHISFMLGKEG